MHGTYKVKQFKDKTVVPIRIRNGSGSGYNSGKGVVSRVNGVGLKLAGKWLVHLGIRTENSQVCSVQILCAKLGCVFRPMGGPSARRLLGLCMLKRIEAWPNLYKIRI